MYPMPNEYEDAEVDRAQYTQVYTEKKRRLAGSVTELLQFHKLARRSSNTYRRRILKAALLFRSPSKQRDL